MKSGFSISNSALAAQNQTKDGHLPKLLRPAKTMLYFYILILLGVCLQVAEISHQAVCSADSLLQLNDLDSCFVGDSEAFLIEEFSHILT